MDTQLIPSSFELLMRTSPYLYLKVHSNSTPHNVLCFFVCQRHMEGFATVEEKIKQILRRESTLAILL